MARDNTPDMSGFGYIDSPRGGQAAPTHDDVVAALPRQRRNRIFFPLPKLPILQIPF